MSHPFGRSPEVVPERRFRVSFSTEAVRDLEAQHDIDAAQILTDILIEEITREIDEEIIADIQTAQARELPYLSPEAVDDILAWTGMTFGYPRHTDFKTRETHNWKQEGF